ncbi:MAG: multifunctional CCA addition/repair protein [Gammaproteobacteria bacterium]|nr:multifunctional CCA addition/repair protein [Pseudomonadales bacterium]MCP5347123.1 multifunctional CCA addition/repair protein [Pseudomonadales bacterium]
MQVYLVGGAVRDKLLGIPVREQDWVVVGADDKALLDLGYRRVGKDFPVFLHPETHEEYALARRETKTGHGYKGFAFDAASTVTLEQDLLRRDLTINAMAEAEDGSLIDPYGGRQDLQDRLLRHVSPAFSEDPLRVLRVARFAARFAQLGFRIADETLELMRGIVGAGELDHLVRERVWQEFETALKETSPVTFFRVLRQCNALAVLLPEVDRLFGIPQPERYHPEVDTGEHVMLVLEQATRLSDDPVVRYATLVHDVGKGVTPRDNWPHHYGHETLGLPLIRDINTRLRVPREYGDLALLVSEYHTRMHQLGEMRSATILNLLEALDAFRRPQRLQRFLLACEADSRGRTGFEDRPYPQRNLLLDAQQAAASLDVGALLAATPEQRTDSVKDLVHHHRAELIREQLGRSK